MTTIALIVVSALLAVLSVRHALLASRVGVVQDDARGLLDWIRDTRCDGTLDAVELGERRRQTERRAQTLCERVGRL